MEKTDKKAEYSTKKEEILKYWKDKLMDIELEDTEWENSLRTFPERKPKGGKNSMWRIKWNNPQQNAYYYKYSKTS